MKRWPEWWEWDLELGFHLLERMEDRDFTEIDLRSMMTGTTRIRRDVTPGRWIVGCRLHGRRWEIILEPDGETRSLVVITAYPVSP